MTQSTGSQYEEYVVRCEYLKHHVRFWNLNILTTHDTYKNVLNSSSASGNKKKRSGFIIKQLTSVYMQSSPDAKPATMHVQSEWPCDERWRETRGKQSTLAMLSLTNKNICDQSQHHICVVCSKGVIKTFKKIKWSYTGDSNSVSTSIRNPCL